MRKLTSLPMTSTRPTTRTRQRRVSPRVPHLGRRQASTTGTTNRMVQHTKRIELNTLTSLVVNIREGYGRHRSLRKEQ